METCFRVFMLLNYMKAYVSMYFLYLMLSFSPKNDVMVMVHCPVAFQHNKYWGGSSLTDTNVMQYDSCANTSLLA